MTATTYAELIDRAKGAADMHDGFPSTTTWMYFLNAEYRKLWTKIVRGGYPITVNRSVITSTGASSYSLAEPFAIIGVFEYVNNRYYKIPVKPMWTQYRVATGAHPKEVYISPAVATGYVTLNFYPTPPTGSVFHIVVIDKPAKIVINAPAPGEANSVNLPFGWEERVVLGMAKRALAEEDTINPAIESEIRELDSQVENHCFDYIMRQANTVESFNDFPDEYGAHDLWYFV